MAFQVFQKSHVLEKLMEGAIKCCGALNSLCGALDSLCGALDSVCGTLNSLLWSARFTGVER